MSVVLETANGQVFQIDADRAVIGRDPHCDVVLADGPPRLAADHAVLRQVSGRWMIEGSDNRLIQVGDGAPRRLNWLQPGDVIRLTEDGPELTFRLGASTGSSVPQPATATPTQPPSQVSRSVVVGRHRDDHSKPASSRNFGDGDDDVILDNESPFSKPQFIWMLAGGALVVAGLLAGIVIHSLTRGSGEESPSDDGTTPEAVRPQPEAEAASRRPRPAPAARPSGRGPESVSPAAQPVAPDLLSAVFSVQARRDGDSPTFQLGSAVAVSGQKLLTSSAVVIAIQQLKDVVPLAVAYSPTAEREYPIVGLTVDPDYRRALDTAEDAKAQTERARLELDDNQDPDRTDALSAAVDAAEQKRFEALERLVYYDEGFITVEGELPAVLPVAKGPSTPQPGSHTTLIGVPFDAADYIVDPQSPPQAARLGGRVFSVDRMAGGSGGPARLLVKLERDVAGQSWAGGVFVNSSGNVIAVYSRPTPPPFRQPARKSVTTHDAAVVFQ